jgi:metal-sulfur cluster biosynthetic enzyme
METLGLFYAVYGEKEQKKITIIMTFTTPACPMGDLITEMVKNEVQKVFLDWNIQMEITFDPLWTPQMIKDPDLQRMFE